jgi:hypothetical protein
MSSGGKESLKSFARSRFLSLKPRAVGKPRKQARQTSMFDPALGLLEQSPTRTWTWHTSTRKGQSTSPSFGPYDWWQKEELLRLQLEEKELEEKWLNQPTTDTISEEVGVKEVGEGPSLSPLLNSAEVDDRMDISSEPPHELPCNPVSEMTSHLMDTAESPTLAQPTKCTKERDGPSERQKTEYRVWKSLLPSLIDPYLLFLKVEEEEISPSMLGGQVLDSECDGSCANKEEAKVLCLFLECMSVGCCE